MQSLISAVTLSQAASRWAPAKSAVLEMPQILQNNIDYHGYLDETLIDYHGNADEIQIYL